MVLSFLSSLGGCVGGAHAKELASACHALFLAVSCCRVPLPSRALRRGNGGARRRNAARRRGKPRRRHRRAAQLAPLWPGGRSEVRSREPPWPRRRLRLMRPRRRFKLRNSSLGSKLSSFLNYFCPPSAPELRGWLRPANLPAFDCCCVHASCAVLTMNTAAGEGPPS